MHKKTKRNKTRIRSGIWFYSVHKKNKDKRKPKQTKFKRILKLRTISLFKVSTISGNKIYYINWNAYFSLMIVRKDKSMPSDTKAHSNIIWYLDRTWSLLELVLFI